MAGLYQAETPGGEATVGANLILSSATNTNTVIMNDPATGDPTCRIQRLGSSAAAAAPPGLPLGFSFLGTVLTRGSLSRQPGKTSFLFVDAFSSAPVAIVDIFDNDDLLVGLYGNVAPGSVAPNLLAPPSGLQCELAPAGSEKVSPRVSALLARMLGATQVQA